MYGLVDTPHSHIAVLHLRIVYGLVGTLIFLYCRFPFSRLVYGLADTSLSCRRFPPSRLVYGLADTPHSLLRPPSHRAASGGGAPCLTAGYIRAERGGTRGDVDRENSDAGGVALKA